MFYPQTTLQLYNNLTDGRITRAKSTKVVKTKAQPKELLYFGRNLSLSIWKKWWAHSYSHNTHPRCPSPALLHHSSLSCSTWLPRLHCRPSPGHSPPSSFLTKSLFTPLSLSLGEPLILSIYLGFAMNIFVVVSLNL